MARKSKATAAGRAAIGLLSGLVLGTAVWAQPQPQPPAPADAAPMPAPFSRECQAAGAADIGEAPLPNVAVALRRQKRIKILAIGASPSAGRQGRRGGYTEQIERILEQAIKGLDVVIVNRGVSGELAADAAVRIMNEVALTEPDLVLWQVGTNDALAYVPVERLRATIVDTVRWLKAHHVDVVLAGLQYVAPMEQDEEYRAVRELIRSIAAQENVVVVRRREAVRLLGHAAESGGGLFPEEFAQTEIGYACLAEYVARAITVGAFARGRVVRPREGEQSPPR